MSQVLDIHGEAPVQFSKANGRRASIWLPVTGWWTTAGQTGYNHITLRIPGTDHLLINEFGLRYDEITRAWSRLISMVIR